MGLAIDDLLFGVRPARWIWKPLVKRLVSGSFAPPRMRPGVVTIPSSMRNLGLYLHVPFCRNLCPYCPYNRIAFDEKLYRAYETGVHREIDFHAERLAGNSASNGPLQSPVVSLYIGGGTPTVVPDGLARMVAHFGEVFGPARDVCVELHPSAMDDHCLALLKSIGVTILSVGVESLSDRLLTIIGRSHDAAAARNAVQRAVRAGFKAVNVDLMFALPSQTLDDLDRDIQEILSLGVDQISTYPIFGFPYTDWGQGCSAISRPSGDLIRRMLALIHRRAEQYGLRQCAVWSFLRPDRKKFSSITRHHYLGFGPSAASMTGNQFYVSTFSVEAYAAALQERLPTALVMPVNRRLEMAYWLYWRVYEMKIPRADFRELFDEEIETVYGSLLNLLVRSGMVSRENGSYRIGPESAYWIHRVQNEYSLNYINRLWGTCREEAWPKEVRL